MNRRAGIVVACLLAASEGAAAEGPVHTETAAPNPGYRAGSLYRFFFGAHWRDAWTTPLEVPVLDLGTFDGGLRPVRQGGGQATTNLHFKSGNGHTWAFRSIDKDAGRTLEPDTAASWIGDIAQEQTSVGHPVGALVVDPLLDAAGILHASPQLFVLPDDARLGEFRKYAGMMGLLEERIEHRLADEHKVADTVTLLERLERRRDERVDAPIYLRARLVDVLVGDWDRHLQQWRWARFDDENGRAWQPIPRDRDLAFTRYDGVLPSLAEYYVKAPTHFSPRYPSLEKLTFTGQFTDRRFLVGLEWPEWEAVANDLAARLTDAVIADAVRRLPPAMYARDGEALERALRARRDALPAAARDFYQLLAGEVDVHGTADGEDFELDRKASGAVEVSVYVRDDETGRRASSPLFHRTFLPDETSEIRLYTMGGADRVVVAGTTDRTIHVRVVAPRRSVSVDDRSSYPSALTMHEPLPDGAVNPADAARLGDEMASAIKHYEPFRDWGSDVFLYPQLSYDSSRGLVLGAFVRRTGYGFQLDPVSSVMSLGAAYSTATNRPRLEYSADLRTRSPFRGLLYLAYSGMDQAKFFGFGNEAPRDSQLASSGFYDVNQGRFVADALLDASIVGPLHGRVGAQLVHAWSVDHAGIMATARPDGADGRTLLSPEAGLKVDTRSGIFTSRRGISLEVVGRHTPAILGNPTAFTKLRGDASATVGGHVLTDVSLSLRLAGEKNWGSYPYFEAAFLGGDAQRTGPLDVTGASTGNLLRGYDLNRFAGDASFVANTELNVALGKWNSVVPLRYGLVGLADVGRVFVDGKGSSKWHDGYGGGLWLGMSAGTTQFQLATALKATVVHSEEGNRFYLMSAFAL